MNDFSDEHAKRTVAEFLATQADPDPYYETYDVVMDSIEKFVDPDINEGDSHNFWEQLRWLYVVLGEFVGDGKNYPTTWNIYEKPEQTIVRGI
jgi:hypothetical protein